MNKDIYIDYLNNPEGLNEDSLANIKDLLVEYPYFGTYRMLYVKNLHNLNDIRFESQLKLSAIYAPDRNVLFDLINGKITISENDNKISLGSHNLEPFENSETESSTTDINDNLEFTDNKEISPKPISEDTIENIQNGGSIIKEENYDSVSINIQDAEEEHIITVTEEKEHISEIILKNIESITKKEEATEVINDSNKEKPITNTEDNSFLKNQETEDSDSSQISETSDSKTHNDSHISEIILKKIKGLQVEQSSINEFENKQELKDIIQARLDEINKDKTIDTSKTPTTDLSPRLHITETTIIDNKDIHTEDIFEINEEISKTEEIQKEKNQKKSEIGKAKQKKSLLDLIEEKFKNENNSSQKTVIDYDDSKHAEELSPTEKDEINTDNEELIDADLFFNLKIKPNKAILFDYERTPENNSLLESEIMLIPIKKGIKKSKKISLIDKFIEENKPIVARNKPEVNSIDNHDFTMPEQEEFFSETLAKIYINQAHYDKALLTYEKLFLKYPEKSVYFASQIKKVKELINKQNN